jgi:hypothetical protein
MAHGHPHARRYPLGFMMDEAALVVERVNNGHATQATLLQMAVSGVLSKKANKAFQEQIKNLIGD